MAWVGHGSGIAGTMPRLTAHNDRLVALGMDARPLEGPLPRHKAGPGRSAHFPLRPMAEVMAHHEEGAELGVTPFEVSK